jgi:hypothetical protein
VVRVNLHNLVWTPLRELSAARPVGSLCLERDVLARLGGPRAKAHPQVRLLWARRRSGEKLVLATDRWTWSAERVLEAYRQRWQIERWHKLLKDGLGLAHLYSFQQQGLRAQLLAAALLGLLLFLAERQGAPCKRLASVTVIRRGLQGVRAALGLGTLWRRNSCMLKRPSKKRRVATTT